MGHRQTTKEEIRIDNKQVRYLNNEMPYFTYQISKIFFFLCFHNNVSIVKQDGHFGSEDINWYISEMQFGNEGPEA